MPAGPIVSVTPGRSANSTHPKRSFPRWESAAPWCLPSTGCAAPFRNSPSSRPPGGPSGRARCGPGSDHPFGVQSRLRAVRSRYSCRDPRLFLGSRLLNKLGDGVVRQPALRPILSDLLHQRSVRDGIKNRITLALIDVASPGEARYDKNVVGLPVEALSANLGHTPTID